MKIHRTDLLWLRVLALLGVMAAFCAGAWAAPGSCIYANPDSGNSGSGTGMGGTGIVEKGTGMGGTGIRPELGQVAGNVIFSQGSVEAQHNGRSRLLARGGSICLGETIVTPPSGSVQIKMADDELITVRPQTRLKIEKFVYGGTKEDNIMLALFKGACRVITGKIGRQYPQNDWIKTPTVLVGVRGTDHEVMVVLPGSSGGYPSGTYDKVNSGVTFIRTERGEIDIHSNQVGFAAKPGDLPVLLKDVPEFYNVAPPIKQEGEVPEGGNKENEPGETGTPSTASPDIQNGMEQPESPVQPEELPSLPEPPDPPSGSEQ